MTERDVHELIGVMVLRMREGEMREQSKDARIAELEAETKALKAEKENKDEHA